MKKFDLFLTVGPNDFSVIKHTLKVNMKNMKGYGNIYLFNENKTFNIKNTRPNHFWKNIFKGNFERAYISFINLYYLFFSKKI
jgi:hypothetical protein